MCIENKEIDCFEDYPEYIMPEDIKALITDEFLKEFRKQLFRIYKNFSLETFYDLGVSNVTSASGWVAAFGKACFLTHNEELFDYWRTLEWYDSDLFDWELEKALLERKLILGNSDEVLGKLLNVDPADIVYCCDCGRFFIKDMTVVLDEKDEDYIEDWVQYRCLYCQDLKDTKDGNKNATEYYKNVLTEIKEYSEKHPIANIEKEKEKMNNVKN